VTGASGFTRTASAGSSRLSAGIGCGAGGGTDTSLGARAALGPATSLRRMRVRPFFPSSAKKPGYADSCFPTGETGAIGAATGAEAGSSSGTAGATGLGWLGAGGATGLASGTAGATGLGWLGAGGATGLAGGTAGATGLGGLGAGGATGLAGSTAGATGLGGLGAGGATGLAGSAAAAGFADDVSCWGSDFTAAAGLGNPAGIDKGGGAARPTLVLPNDGLSSDFPVIGQVRVSGRCCFSQ